MEFNLFRFFISGVKNQVVPDSDLWQSPLSGKTGENCNSDFTTGDYYLAACKFLSDNSFLFLKKGLKFFLNKSVQINQIIRIKIFLEKHGAFYHPLKIEAIVANNQIFSFVLNGAVDKKGLGLIQNEYELLSLMNKNSVKQIEQIEQIDSKQYTPKVFELDFITTNKGKIGFFLGQWFDNYKEFHVSYDNDIQQVSIWESNGNCNYIEISNAFEIYFKITKILTYYYNLKTFEEILLWHHAAGDFIVNQENGKFNVKLITIRKYSSLIQHSTTKNDKTTLILPSLLFFFLNLSIKMRIDRINGTGKLIMIDKSVIDSIITGFLSGLDEKSKTYDYGDIKPAFIEFFLQFNLKQILEIMINILESHYSDPVEISLIQKNLKNHCKILYSIFKNI